MDRLALVSIFYGLAMAFVTVGNLLLWYRLSSRVLLIENQLYMEQLNAIGTHQSDR